MNTLSDVRKISTKIMEYNYLKYATLIFKDRFRISYYFSHIEIKTMFGSSYSIPFTSYYFVYTYYQYEDYSQQIGSTVMGIIKDKSESIIDKILTTG